MISDRDVVFYREHGYLAAIHQGSIYENQSDASRRYFAVTPESMEPARTRRSRASS